MLFVRPFFLAESSELSHHPQEFLRSLQLWKQFLLGVEFPGVHAAAAAPQLDRMLQVQHLVEQYVFDRIARYAGMVKNAANHDGIVRWIIVAEAAARMVPAPSKLRASHKSVKKSPVEVV